MKDPVKFYKLMFLFAGLAVLTQLYLVVQLLFN